MSPGVPGRALGGGGGPGDASTLPPAAARPRLTCVPTTTICGSWMMSAPTVLKTSCSLLMTGISASMAPRSPAQAEAEAGQGGGDEWARPAAAAAAAPVSRPPALLRWPPLATAPAHGAAPSGLCAPRRAAARQHGSCSAWLGAAARGARSLCYGPASARRRVCSYFNIFATEPLVLTQEVSQCLLEDWCFTIKAKRCLNRL